MTTQSLIEKLEAEMEADRHINGGIATAETIGLHKAISIIRAHQSEPPMDLDTVQLWKNHHATYDTKISHYEFERIIEAAIAAINDYAGDAIPRKDSPATDLGIGEFRAPSSSAPTEAELNAILDSKEPMKVVTLQNGEIRAVPSQCSEIIGTTRDGRVVCAALMDDAGRLILSPRHFDKICHETIALIGGDWKAADQGFVDQWGHFMDRERAFIVAKASGQIRRKTGNPDSQELFSEDLY